jgi:transcriptional regulator with XRE-family HTH domain
VKKYSEQIYKIRKAEGLSQEEFGNRIGVSRQMVSKWEIGESSPRTDKINKICTTFGITPGEFISDDEQDKESKKITKIIFNNKKEKVIKSQQQRKKRIKQITILIISVISTIYIVCSLCKFIYLKSLNKEMLKFKGLNNYYFVLTLYMGSKAVDNKEVWYLDGKYKIEETYSSYDKEINEQKTIYYIDTNNNTEKIYSQDNVSTSLNNTTKLFDDELYKNGNLLYNCFPRILCNSNREIFKVSAQIGMFTINKTQYNIIFIDNHQEITLDKNNTDSRLKLIHLMHKAPKVEKNHQEILQRH